MRERQERYEVELQGKREEFDRFNSLRGREGENGEEMGDRETEGDISLRGELEEQGSFFTTQGDPCTESLLSLHSLSTPESSMIHSKSRDEIIARASQLQQEEENDEHNERESSVVSDLTRSSLYTSSDSSSHSLLKVPTRPGHVFERSNVNKSPRKSFV